MQLAVPDTFPVLLVLILVLEGALIGGIVRALQHRLHPNRRVRISMSLAILLGMLGSGVVAALERIVLPVRDNSSGDVSSLTSALDWVLASALALVAAGAVTWIAMNIAGRMAAKRAKRPAPERLARVLASGESTAVEFKSSARYNLMTGTKDPKLEIVIAKTIAGFANASGGMLVIGVNDAGEIVGLAEDFALVKFPDPDRYELWLRDWITRALGATVAATLDVEFVRTDDKDVCLVTVAAATRPVFLYPGKDVDPEFWVRSGNSTRKLHVVDALAYVASHGAYKGRAAKAVP